MQQLLTALGGRVLTNFRHIGRFSLMLHETMVWGFIRPFKGYPLRRRELFNQMLIIGVQSLPIVGLIGGIMGMILALQSAYQLEKFGAEMYIGSMVGIALARELGPLMAAIMLAGRVGARFAAELGTMKGSEEIDALEVMALNPVRFLVVPRILAIVAMLPCLTVLADLIGFGGGMFTSVYIVGVDPELYYQKTVYFMVINDLATGLVKSCFFAVIIGGVGCYKGMNVTEGAAGVGLATTEAVVISIFLIVCTDCIATAFFYFLG